MSEPTLTLAATAGVVIDADGFIRYKHFGEGAYGETEAKIRELLAERDRISN